MTPTEWAVEAFARLQKEWAAQADWEASRKIPPSRKTLELQAFLMTAPDSVKRKVLGAKYAPERKTYPPPPPPPIGGLTHGR